MKQLQATSSIPGELLEIFNDEAEDHMRSIYDGLNRLKNERADNQALASVRRASHTLKGAAAAVQLESATRLAHRMEDLLDKLADQDDGVSPECLKLLLATADQLHCLTSGEFNVDVAAKQIFDLYQRYTNVMGEGELVPASDSTETPKLSPHELGPVQCGERRQHGPVP